MHLQGGLLTEYRFGQMPEKGNFPARNRIIAGLCDAVIVVEARQKGGALITAELANSYDREVFALPGRIYDTQSLGCNDLIKTNAAQLIQSAEDLIIGLAWDVPQSNRQIQTKLLAQLTTFEQEIICQLQAQPLQIDNLMLALCCTAAELSISLTSLEIKGVIAYLPGKFIRSYY
jgi:DNA processing protein